MTTAETPIPEATGEYTFKAEIQQLLNILVHSLYKEQEIFLRELVSNASDALTRLHFEMLTNKEVFDADAELAIRIDPTDEDAEEKWLVIRDSGIGMTQAELARNLGTIAQSGAREFLKSVQEGKDAAGEAGVGSPVVGTFALGADVIEVASIIHVHTVDPSGADERRMGLVCVRGRVVVVFGAVGPQGAGVVDELEDPGLPGHPFGGPVVHRRAVGIVGHLSGIVVFTPGEQAGEENDDEGEAIHGRTSGKKRVTVAPTAKATPDPWSTSEYSSTVCSGDAGLKANASTRCPFMAILSALSCQYSASKDSIVSVAMR